MSPSASAVQAVLVVLRLHVLLLLLLLLAVLLTGALPAVRDAAALYSQVGSPTDFGVRFLGDIPWANVNNLDACDGLEASVADQPTDVLLVYGFNFLLPPLATLVQTRFSVRGRNGDEPPEIGFAVAADVHTAPVNPADFISFPSQSLTWARRTTAAAFWGVAAANTSGSSFGLLIRLPGTGGNTGPVYFDCMTLDLLYSLPTNTFTDTFTDTMATFTDTADTFIATNTLADTDIIMLTSGTEAPTATATATAATHTRTGGKATAVTAHTATLGADTDPRTAQEITTPNGSGVLLPLWVFVVVAGAAVACVTALLFLSGYLLARGRSASESREVAEVLESGPDTITLSPPTPASSLQAAVQGGLQGVEVSPYAAMPAPAAPQGYGKLPTAVDVLQYDDYDRLADVFPGSGGDVPRKM